MARQRRRRRPLAQHLPGSLERVPVAKIRGIDHAVGGHHDFPGQGLNGHASKLPDVGRSGTGQHSLDRDALVAELMAKGLADSEHEGLGRTLNTIETLGATATTEAMLRCGTTSCSCPWRSDPSAAR